MLNGIIIIIISDVHMFLSCKTFENEEEAEAYRDWGGKKWCSHYRWGQHCAPIILYYHDSTKSFRVFCRNILLAPFFELKKIMYYLYSDYKMIVLGLFTVWVSFFSYQTIRWRRSTWAGHAGSQEAKLFLLETWRSRGTVNLLGGSALSYIFGRRLQQSSGCSHHAVGSSRGRYSLSRSRVLSPPKKARCSAAADMVRLLKGKRNKRQH